VIITRRREHVIQPRPYETIRIAAETTLDTLQEDIPDDATSVDSYLDATLDSLLADDVARGVESAPDSHLSDFYPE
jgi:hypothetical protein